VSSRAINSVKVKYKRVIDFYYKQSYPLAPFFLWGTPQMEFIDHS